jgi:RNA polymerase sporulation-specific sigma factor
MSTLTSQEPCKTFQLQSMTDEDIVELAKCGREIALEHLINKYKNFVRAKARSYFLIGADREDIIQEGMIGLYKAIRDFRGDKLSSFRAFAELCLISLLFRIPCTYSLVSRKCV